MIRISPRLLDAEDNLPAAFKWAKDAIAEIFHPNLAPGRADEDKTISWHFDQEKGRVKEYGIRIIFIQQV